MTTIVIGKRNSLSGTKAVRQKSMREQTTMFTSLICCGCDSAIRMSAKILSSLDPVTVTQQVCTL